MVVATGRPGMHGYVINPPPTPKVDIIGGGWFPVRRIFCIGRNFADHVREMGGDPKAQPPVFFTKPADALVPSGATISYPLATKNLHYEGELVVALADGGSNIDVTEAERLVFGFAAGCDLTRRDLQAAAKQAGAPWDAAKGFDRSAPVGPIMRAALVMLENARLTLWVNGQVRQDAALADMVWSVPEIIAALSRQFELRAGDLIYAGTPSGVGPLVVGDDVAVKIGDLPLLEFHIAASEAASSRSANAVKGAAHQTQSIAPSAEEKARRYREASQEIAAVIEGETNLIARMASVSNILHHRFEYYYWTGFYLVDSHKTDELVIGPYQGTLGCLRIPFGQGVCGAAAQRRETIVVEDVLQFAGHIACDPRSRSEIVIPVFDSGGRLIAVFDVDSDRKAMFDEADRRGLEAIMRQSFALASMR
ncbi:MAG: GAF domain-containing protein [Alphaproteobacteria bacterium]|nr:GAF domain-containing protein [Alphaproteobacteria bacterium]